MNRIAAILLGLAVIGLWSGCSNYRLGTEGNLTFQSLYVEPVINRTSLPQAHALVSTAIRAEFLRDGRLNLVNSPDEADATLSLTLMDYHREVATVRPGDTGLARTFALTLGANLTLRDNRTGKILFEKRPVKTSRDAYTDSGQLQAEYQTLPLLAEALGQRAAHAVLDVW